MKNRKTRSPRLQSAGIKISKIHLSSALKIQPTPEAREELKNFADDVYLHQVVARDEIGKLKFYRDLPDALALPIGNSQSAIGNCPNGGFIFTFRCTRPPRRRLKTRTTICSAFWICLAANPEICSHLEMETYTWEVLPPELKSRSVVDQLAAEYDWTLARLAERGMR